jgi:hypothetical protein
VLPNILTLVGVSVLCVFNIIRKKDKWDVWSILYLIFILFAISINGMAVGNQIPNPNSSYLVVKQVVIKDNNYIVKCSNNVVIYKDLKCNYILGDTLWIKK